MLCFFVFDLKFDFKKNQNKIKNNQNKSKLGG